MPRVTGPDGADLGDVTSPAALDYYRREAGYDVHDDDTAATDAVEVTVEAGPPAKSALKPEWVDYALSIDPDNADEINAMTVAELQEHYGTDE